MRKIKNLALTLLTAIMCVTSSLTSFAMYDDGSYDVVEDDGTPIVDNKIHPNATCQVLLYVLYPNSAFKEGRFTWDIQYKNESSEWSYVAFQNRWENAHDLETPIGNGRILTYKIQLEPGTYYFSGGDDFEVLNSNYELERIVETPEMVNLAMTDVDAYMAEYNKLQEARTTTVTGPTTIYAISNVQEGFVEDNLDEYVSYIQSKATENSDDILNNINVDDYNSLDELLNALREAGCTEEQIEMARATYADAYEGVNDEVVETEPTTVEEQHVETEGEESGISPLMPIIAIVLILVIICGIYVFIKKKDR